MKVFLLFGFLIAFSVSEAQFNVDEIVLQMRSGASDSERDKVEETIKAVIGADALITQPGKSKNPFFRRLIVVSTSSTISEEELNILRGSPLVELVEYTPEWEYTLTPNDMASTQWSLQTIQAEDAWDIERGDPNVKIAIIDDAFSLAHEDFSSQFWSNTAEVANNSIDDDGNGYIDDVLGWDGADNDNDVSSSLQALAVGRHDHGSHVAGIASGATNNGKGMASIGFNTRIMPIKTASSTGNYRLSFAGILTAMDYAVENKADIISMSLGGSGYSAIFQNAVTLAYDSGIVVIAAAGNNRNTQLMYPASYKHVISVASSAQSDMKSSFTTYNDSVDITAPGSGIYSIQAMATSSASYSNKSGTSMACPMVAGAVALMISKNSTLSPDEIEACLKSGADDITLQNPTTAWGLGAGRLNAFQSLQCVKTVLAAITVDKQSTCAGSTLFFRDSSRGNVTQRLWTFTGGTPATSTSANPSVVYSVDGVYAVKLVVTDGVESDTSELLQYISIREPSATLSSAVVNIRAGQQANLPIHFVGNPPFRFKLNDGSRSYWINNIYANPYYVPLSPINSTVYTLDSMFDASCLGGVNDTFKVNVLAAVNLQSQCITLRPDPIEGKDAFLNSRLPTSNSGSNPDILASAWTFNGTPLTVRSVIDFDWNSIPSNAVIDSAYLSLYYNSTSGNAGHSGTNAAKLYRVTSSWAENTVTWNNQPTYTLANSVVMSETTSNTQDKEDVEITDLVKDIWSDRSGSHGFMFKLDNETILRSQKYGSSDHLDSAKRPKLRVCYIAPVVTAPLTCLKASVKQKISDTEGNFTATLDNTDWFGVEVVSAGDIDGDGIADLYAGASFDDDGGSASGAIYALRLNQDGTVKSHTKVSQTSGNLGVGVGAGDRFGTVITVLGDMDNDGIDDIAVSAHADDDGSTDAGAFYVLFMNANGTVKSKQKVSDTQGGLSYSLGSYDFFGMGLANVGDLDNDGIVDLAAGIHQDDASGSNAGAILILLMNSNGTVKSHKKLTNGVNGFPSGLLGAGDLFGRTIRSLGDIDADGVSDIAVGANMDDDGATNAGAVYIIRLNADGTAKAVQKLSNTAGNLGNILAANDRLSVGLSSLPDIDEDGINELLVGALEDDAGGTNKGAFYLIKMNAQGEAQNVKKYSGLNVVGLSSELDVNDKFCWGMGTVGDLNGDGIAEIAAGVGGDDDGGTDRGAIYILDLADTCAVDKSPLSCLKASVKQKISDTQGNFTATLANDDWFGHDVASVGDLNGDGINDLLVGADQDDDGQQNAGAIYQLYLDSNGTVESYAKISNTFGGFGGGLSSGDLFGTCVVSLGDADGDGVTDYLVSANQDDDGGANYGAVYILYMNANGTVKTKRKISATTGGLSYGLAVNDYFGLGLETLGDLDNDGNIDIAVAVPTDDNDGVNSGSVLILFLNANGTVKSYKNISNGKNGFPASLLGAGDNFGRGIANIGDIDNDGVIDIVVSAIRDDDAGTDAGALYVLRLNSDGTIKGTQKITNGIGGFGQELSTNDIFGVGLRAIGDLNSNGVNEFMVGSYQDDDGGFNTGCLYVLETNSAGVLQSTKKYSAANITGMSVGIDNNDRIGIGLAPLGDLDLDGHFEIAVSTYNDDDGGSDRGAVYILELEDSCIVLPIAIDVPVCRLNADFSVEGTCLTDSFVFTSLSTDSSGRSIVGYEWIVDGKTRNGDSLLKWKFTAGGARDVQLIVRNDDGYNCKDTSTITIEVKDTLSYRVEGNTVICFGDTAMLSVVVDSCTGGPFSYFWTPQLDISDPNVANPKIFTKIDRSYSVTVFSGTGKFLQKTVAVDVDSSCCKSDPRFSIQGEPFCPSDSVGFVNTSVSLGSGASFLWSFGSDAHLSTYAGADPPNISYSSAGAKEVSLVLRDDCDVDTFTLSFVINELPYVPILNDTMLCQADSLELTIGVESASDYTWGPVSSITYVDARPYFIPTRVEDNRLYYTETDFITGCTDTSFFEVEVDSFLMLHLGADSTICLDSFLLLPDNVNNVKWSNGTTSTSLWVNTSGQYFGTLTNGVCESTDSVNFTFFKPSGDYLPKDTTFCDIGGLLVAKLIPPGAIISWSTGQSGISTIVAPTSGEYWINVSSPQGCSSRDTSAVNILPSPIIVFSGDSLICDSLPVDLAIELSDFTSFVWSSDGDVSSLQKTFSTRQSVQVTAFNGECRTDAIVDIRELKTPEFTLGPDTFICDDEEYGVVLETTSSTPLAWNTGMNASQITVYDAGKYWATSTNECGVFTDSIAVADKDCNCTVVVPDAFSPNDDGINDDFGVRINDCEVTELNYFIANRLGVIVFIGKTINDRWDGYYKGEPALPGVYNLVLDYRLVNSRYKTKFFKNQRITIVR